MPKSKTSANLEHDDSIDDNNFDEFAGGDSREEFDASSLRPRRYARRRS